MSDTIDWLLPLVGVDSPLSDGSVIAVKGNRYVVRDGILRQVGIVSDAQAQTADSFGFKWDRRDTFESAGSRTRMRAWLIERYGDVAGADWWAEYGDRPVVLDAGCGAALSALELLDRRLHEVRYVGVDISRAVDVASERFRERGIDARFLQADLTALPFPERSVDVVFSEGVLHHTDSTEQALKNVAKLLRPGGRILFYVYRTKGPIREFTDDYVRERLQAMDPDEAWNALRPLTMLGRALGELHTEIDVPESIPLLGIPAGRIDLQRFFYWHVCKAFYHPDLDLEETNHINYDWFAPRNAHRQTPEQVRAWCAEAGLVIEREWLEQAGITVIARAEG